MQKGISGYYLRRVLVSKFKLVKVTEAGVLRDHGPTLGGVLALGNPQLARVYKSNLLASAILTTDGANDIRALLGALRSKRAVDRSAALGQITGAGLAFNNSPLVGRVLAVGDGHVARVDKCLLSADLVLGANGRDDGGAFLGASWNGDGLVPEGALLLQVGIIGAISVRDLCPTCGGVLALGNRKAARVDECLLDARGGLATDAADDRGAGLCASGDRDGAIQDSTLAQVAGAKSLRDLGPLLVGVLALRDRQTAGVGKRDLDTDIVLGADTVDDRGAFLGASRNGCGAVKDATLAHVISAVSLRDLCVNVAGFPAVGFLELARVDESVLNAGGVLGADRGDD